MPSADGKSIGTYLEKKFRDSLNAKYTMAMGSAARGIDFPALLVDLKTTSSRQPQSSCPCKNARQKIYGLGYDLMVFVYDKTESESSKTVNLNIEIFFNFL